MAHYTQNDVNEVIDALKVAANVISERLGKESNFSLDDEYAIFDEAVLHCELSAAISTLEKIANGLGKSYCN